MKNLSTRHDFISFDIMFDFVWYAFTIVCNREIILIWKVW